MEKLNLYQKIQAVSNKVRNIEKDMTVGTGNNAYKAVSDKTVTLAVKDAETEFKLLSVPIKQELINSEVLRVQGDRGEKLVYMDNIKMTVRFVDLEDTSVFLDVEAFGKGVDSGDKGFGKASTYARKYALLNAYKIATGEDPDSEKSQDEKPFGMSEKKQAIVDYLAKYDKVRENTLQHFNAGSTDDLTEAQISIIYNKFKAKKYL